MKTIQILTKKEMNNTIKKELDILKTDMYRELNKLRCMVIDLNNIIRK